MQRKRGIKHYHIHHKPSHTTHIIILYNTIIHLTGYNPHYTNTLSHNITALHIIFHTTSHMSPYTTRSLPQVPHPAPRQRRQTLGADGTHIHRPHAHRPCM